MNPQCFRAEGTACIDLSLPLTPTSFVINLPIASDICPFFNVCCSKFSFDSWAGHNHFLFLDLMKQAQ